jgi:hypothetical protein
MDDLFYLASGRAWLANLNFSIRESAHAARPLPAASFSLSLSCRSPQIQEITPAADIAGSWVSFF